MAISFQQASAAKQLRRFLKQCPASFSKVRQQRDILRGQLSDIVYARVEIKNLQICLCGNVRPSLPPSSDSYSSSDQDSDSNSGEKQNLAPKITPRLLFWAQISFGSSKTKTHLCPSPQEAWKKAHEFIQKTKLKEQNHV